MVHQAFLNLEPERQEHIRLACITEFAANGYKQASTNNMCRAAGISKGLLFHYFSSKKGLYMYLLDHVVGLLLVEFYAGLSGEREDIIERMLRWNAVKLDIARKYPLYYQFNVKMYIESDPAVKGEIAAMIERLTQEGYDKLLDNVDYSAFRKGVNVAKAIEMVNYVLNGLAEKYAAEYRKDTNYRLKHGEKLYAELREYLDILRDGFYG